MCYMKYFWGTILVLFCCCVAVAQPLNGPITNTYLLPDDPLFGSQWHLFNQGDQGGIAGADLDALGAWEIGTGGVSAAGDTIVVAIIDKGIDRLHPDLAANLWVNRGEIPNDGKDNDQNGYIDDYRGWNIRSQNDRIEGAWPLHGTSLAGLIGAVGNNGIGISGLNWHVKIMFVAIDGSVADILSAFEYVRRQRVLYHQSQGKKGAFVVAVNCSWGILNGNPSDEPLWCAAYDSLGAAGILSVAAAPNSAVNVDETGDLPSTCPSPFLIVVTNLDRRDEKVAAAAWGPKHVDMGAYGQDVLSTSPDNTFGLFSGTSYAVPQVVGALGLLYAAPCPDLVALAWADPAMAALRARACVLNTVTPNPSLEGATSTGGRLNTGALLRTHEAQCAPCSPPFSLKTDSIGQNGAILLWHTLAPPQSSLLRWRAVGATQWSHILKPSSPYHLARLEPCTEYEFEVGRACGPNNAVVWSPAQRFVTGACCVPPAQIEVMDNTGAALTLRWTMAGGKGYRVKYRRPGQAWHWSATSTNTVRLDSLEACAFYETQIQPLCDSVPGDFSAPLSFQTAGCGACTDAPYCPPLVSNAQSEWIAGIAIGPWSCGTTYPPLPYQFERSAAHQMLTLSPGSLPITITPGFAGQPTKEFYRIYIDYNADGDFEDAHELAFEPGFATSNPVQGLLWAPDSLKDGFSRMRVMMKYRTALNAAPTPCENYPFGQVLDFCVRLQSSVVAAHDASTLEGRLNIFPNPVRETFTFAIPKAAAGDCTLMVWDASGVLVHQEQIAQCHLPSASINARHWPAGFYTAKVATAENIFWGKLVKN